MTHVALPRHLRVAVPTLRQCAAAVLLAGALFAMTLMVSPAAANTSLPTGGVPLEGVAGVLLGCILLPICEEVLFRDALPRLLSAAMPVPLVLLLSAAAFAILHVGLGWHAWAVLFAGALLLSALYARFDNILVPIVAHAVLNGAITAYAAGG